MRIETDNLGSMELPSDCLYGINTARAAENFRLTAEPVHKELIKEMITIKKAAAIANAEAGELSKEKSDAIALACDKLINGGDFSMFVTDSLQGGAGTSLNMNTNEVIANTALKLIGKAAGEYEYIHPLNDVNKNQSTNDVFPTALRIASIRLIRTLSDRCSTLQQALQEKENEFSDIKKIGRTELMNAVQITMGQEFGAYAQAISRDRWRIYKAEERLRYTNLGGSAVGRLASKKYVFKLTELIRQYTGIGLARAEYPMDITQNNDVFAEVSGFLKSLAVNIIKISSDLRLMNSNFLGEIKLKPMQAGSTAMPGKINPVIPEAAIQSSIRVIANDSAVTYAASMGNFELNAFMPLIANSLLDSLKLLINTLEMFTEKCIKPLTANRERCEYHLNNSVFYAMEYVNLLGYKTVEQLLNEYGDDKQAFIKAAKQLLNGE